MRIVLTALALLGPAAVQAVPEFARPANTPIRGTQWQLAKIGEAPAAAPATLVLQRTTATGSTGCATFTATHSLVNGTITLDPIATTPRPCPAEQAPAANAFLTRLQQGGRLSVGHRGQLTLSARNLPDLEFVRAAAAATPAATAP